MSEVDSSKKLNVVIVGHVDHGKSTVIGRLLADTNSLPEGKLESIKLMCEKNAKVFEYAFLLDALRDERDQGITIDVARCFFKSNKRDYVILDSPGHKEFLKNMVTGAAHAEAALIVIDAKEGIKENSHRHAYLLSMLGIKQVVVLVNKMDTKEYSEGHFNSIKEEFTQYLNLLNIHPSGFVPISALDGENITQQSDQMPWYSDGTVLDFLDSFENKKELEDVEFRMFLQDVYKFTERKDDKRIYVGTVDSGSLNVGDEVVFFPSMKKSKIKTFETIHGESAIGVRQGEHIAFTLDEQIFVKRGELVCKRRERIPHVLSEFIGNVFWMGKDPLIVGKKYYLKVGTQKEELELVSVLKSINTSNLDKDQNIDILNKYEVGECHFRTKKPIPCDFKSENEVTSRFVLVDDYEISGGGIITEGMDSELLALRKNTSIRGINLIKGNITHQEKVDRLGQRPALIFITGNALEKRKKVAAGIERFLFEQGRFVNYLGYGTIKYGIGSDIKGPENNEEMIRRLAEVNFLFLEAGLISINTIRSLSTNNIEQIKTLIGSYEFLLINIGTEELEEALNFSVTDDDLDIIQEIVNSL